jgi:hypothetical protein
MTGLAYTLQVIKTRKSQLGMERQSSLKTKALLRRFKSIKKGTTGADKDWRLVFNSGRRAISQGDRALRLVKSGTVVVVLALLSVAVLLSVPSRVQATEELAADLAEDREVDLGLVPRALFTLSISKREPGEELTDFSADQRKVFFFTELGDLTGQRVTHRWEHNGKVMAEVEFDVGGSPWRVYSSKTMRPDWVGEWTASVVDPQGRVLSSRTFSYLAAPLDEENQVEVE